MSVRIAWERRGTGTPVVLVQGLGYARWGWEPVVDGLGARHELIFLDNRGVGGSDAPPGPYTVAEMARDVVSVLDEAGVERAHVVGTSLGGMIAQELALLAPERVGALVLVCTTPGGPRAYPLPEPTVRLFAEAPSLEPEVALRRFIENALAPATAASRPELVERILAHRLATAQPFPAWLAQAAAGTTFDAWERVPQIAAPTLVLHGSEDRVVDPRNADLLVDLVPGARLVRVPGTGHLLYWEEPDAFVASVGGFLGEHPLS